MLKTLELTQRNGTVVLRMDTKTLLESFDHLVRYGPDWVFMRPHSDDYLDSIREILCADTIVQTFFEMETTMEFAQELEGLGFTRISLFNTIE